MKFNLAAVSKILVTLATIWSLIISYETWVTPIKFEGIEVSESANKGFIRSEVIEIRKFSDVSALGVVPLLVPVLITFMAMWAVFKIKIVVLIMATVLLSLFWLLAGFTIGMTYVPSVILLIFVSVANVIAIQRN